MHTNIYSRKFLFFFPNSVYEIGCICLANVQRFIILVQFSFAAQARPLSIQFFYLSLSLSLFARSPSFYLPCKVFVSYSYPHTLSPSHSPLCSRVAGHLIRNHVHMCTFSEIKLLSTRRLRFVRSIVNTQIDRQYLFWLA